MPRMYADPVTVKMMKGQGHRKAAFLDRDGVINVDYAYVYSKEKTDWIEGIFELCRFLRDAGYWLVVVTNQAGIARGYYTEAQFLEYTRWIHGEFERHGAPLLATYYCPHHPEASVEVLRMTCRCRKPAPGMIIEAARYFDLALEGSLLIGDKLSDIEAGAAAGVGQRFLLSRPESFVSNHSLEVTQIVSLSEVRERIRGVSL